MANLQIKGIEDNLYEEIKKLAVDENRSINQQVLFLVKEYLARRHQLRTLKTPAQVLCWIFPAHGKIIETLPI